MNPKEESWTPGEVHFYSRRESPQGSACEPPKKGRLAWFKKNKALALSLGNLVLLAPMVFLLYPFLLSQADKLDQRSLGSLTVQGTAFVTDDQVLVRIRPRFADGAPNAGTLVVHLGLGGEKKSFSRYLDASLGVPQDIQVTFPKPKDNPSVDLEALWGDLSEKWTLSPEY